MMNIVIPVAGPGSSPAQAGFKVPKPYKEGFTGIENCKIGTAMYGPGIPVALVAFKEIGVPEKVLKSERTPA